MTPEETKKILIDVLRLKTLQEDWHGVSDAANDLREVEVAIRLNLQVQIKDERRFEVPGEGKDASPAAIPPVEMEIPHHVNEVLGLLKLSDEQLVDKMFPDYSKLEGEHAN